LRATLILHLLIYAPPVAELGAPQPVAGSEIENENIGKPASIDSSVEQPADVIRPDLTNVAKTKVLGPWTTIVETYRDRPIAFVEDLLLRAYPDFKLEAWQKRFLKAVGVGAEDQRAGWSRGWQECGVLFRADLAHVH
jgi:hypothetical protein